MTNFFDLILKTSLQKQQALLYSSYSIIFVLSFLQFPSQMAFFLSIIFLGSFFHLKRFFTLPALLAQLIILPQYTGLTLILAVWFYLNLPATYLKYTNPEYPWFRSLLGLITITPFLSFYSCEFIVKAIVYAQFILWIGAFLTSNLPDGLPSKKTIASSIAVFISYLFLAITLAPFWTLNLIPLGLSLINAFQRNIQTQVLTRIFLFYYAVITIMIPQVAFSSLIIFSVATVYFILDGGFYARPLANLRRNPARPARTFTFSSQTKNIC